MPSRFVREEDQTDSESRTVLLVEDNPTDVFVITEAVQESGLKLRLQIATNGQEALRYLQTFNRDQETPLPALVLLDLNLPKVAGIEVLRELRTDSQWNRVPVIVVTSSVAGEDFIAAQHLGAEAYFQKPTDLEQYMELAHLVRRVLGAGEHT